MKITEHIVPYDVEEFELRLAEESNILSVHTMYSTPHIFVAEDPKAAKRVYRFKLLPTNVDVKLNVNDLFVGTVVVSVAFKSQARHLFVELP